MVKIREAIVVEGRYDKNTLSQVVDAPILETAGFGIMKDKMQLNLLRRVARERGLIIFTDSDGAGFVIRNFLKGRRGRATGTATATATATAGFTGTTHSGTVVIHFSIGTVIITAIAVIMLFNVPLLSVQRINFSAYTTTTVIRESPKP